MVKITNGISTFEVTEGAFNSIYSKQGFVKCKDEAQDNIEADVENDVDANDSSDLSIIDSRRVFTLFRNITFAEYNNKNRKTVIYEQQGNDSLLVFYNSKLEFSKMLIFQNHLIQNLHWLKDSNFIIFSFLTSKKEHAIGVIYVYSKYFNNKIRFHHFRYT